MQNNQMKITMLFLAFVLLLPVAVSAQDDVYYIPSKDVRQVADKKGSVLTSAQAATPTLDCYSQTRDVDEYNRRVSATTVSSGEETDLVLQDTMRQVESSFDDATSDVAFPYTKRVMRFHAPHVGFIVSSPYYWDVCYADVWDVYYDGWATYTPSYVYWSYSYDPWYYNRWHFRTCWDFTWGWYDPWYFRAYWGWGRPIYWGWNRPVYHPRHIGRPMWGYRGFDRGYAPGFGRNGGRVFSGRGFDAPRAGAFAGRTTVAPRGNGGRQLSGVFRSNRTPAVPQRQGQVNRGVRQQGGTIAARPNGGNNRNGNAGVRRQGGRNNGSFEADRTQPRQAQPSRNQSNARNSSQGTYSRPESSRNTPSFGGGSGRPSSTPSSVGRSGGGAGRSGGMSGGGGVSRGGRR